MKIRNILFHLLLFFSVSCSYFKKQIYSIKIEDPPYNLLQKKISFYTKSKSESFISYWVKGTEKILYSKKSKNTLFHKISVLFLLPEKEYQFLIHSSKNNTSFVSDTLSFVTPSVPEFIPEFTLDNAANYSFDGLIFLRTQMNPGVQLLLDDKANVVWYQNSDTSFSRPFDLVSENSYLSLSRPNLIYEINLDGDTLVQIHTDTNVLHHEVTKDKNNNIIALSYKEKVLDLSSYGGLSYDTIKGDGIVVYDNLGNLVWEWNIFDHEDPLEYKNIIDIKSDWSHGNAIGITPDNNYIISFRSFDQLWKINSNNGEIMWKLGLNGEINMEPNAFFYQQHAIHHIKGDTFLLFDNGHKTYRMTSRALFFSLNKNQFSTIKIVELSKELFSFKQGSVYLFDRNKLLFSSSVNNVIFITDMEGNVLWKLKSDHAYYRAYYLQSK